MARIALTAVGSDRPGIIAAVAGALVDRGGNIEDSAMTLLGGRFAMMLIVRVPDDEDVEGLEAAVGAATARFDLDVVARSVAAPAAATPPSDRLWSVSVHGADRPGIVHRVTSVLADRGVNVVDLTTRVVGADESSYVMLLVVTLPDEVDPEDLLAELAGVGSQLGVDVDLRLADVDVL